MTNYLRELKSVLSAATEWGVNQVPYKVTDEGKPDFDWKTRKKFISACHRGYEKAQNRIVELLEIINSDHSLSEKEKRYWTLIFRRVIDTIAFSMLKLDRHIIRRFTIHNHPPNLYIPVIKEANKKAMALNSESRLTFALLADVSTFFHICDILRVDFRNYPVKVSFIELKTGKVNEALLEKLDKYEPDKSSIERIKSDKSIEKKHIKQAIRIVNQKIRIKHVEEIIDTEKGVDIKLDLPIQFTDFALEIEKYDQFLNELCNKAKISKIASGTVQACIHIGVGYDDDRNISTLLARKAASSAYLNSLAKNSKGLNEVREELKGSISESDFLKGWDIFDRNLTATSDTPFPLWGIDRENLFSVIDGKMCIFSIFDMPSFIWLGRSMGLDINLTTRKEAEETAQEIGRLHLPRWGHRAIRVITSKGEFTMGGGMLSRFMNDLDTPLPYLISWKSM